MNDAKHHLEPIDSVPTPDQWRAIEEGASNGASLPHATSYSSGRARRERVLAAVVAFSVFGAAAALGLTALGDDRAMPLDAIAPRTVTVTFDASAPRPTPAPSEPSPDIQVPTATMTFGEHAVSGRAVSIGWDGIALPGEAFPASQSPAMVPAGAEVRIAGDAVSISGWVNDCCDESLPASRMYELDLERSAQLPSDPGRYVLEFEARWDTGAVTFLFPIQVDSSEASPATERSVSRSSSDDSTADVDTLSSLELTLEGRTPLAGSADAVGVGTDAWVWRSPTAATPHATVTRFDAAGNAVDTITVEARPVVEAGGVGLASGGGFLWAAGTSEEGTRAHLSQVDPGTGDVVREIPLSGEAAIDIAIGETAAWVASLGDGDRGLLERVDVETGTAQTALSFDAFLPSYVLTSPSSVYIVGTLGDGDIADRGSVVVVDQATGQRVRTIDLPASATAAGTDGNGRPWVAAGTTLRTLEDASGAPTIAIPLDVTSIVPHQSGFWAVGHDGSGSGSELVRVTTTDAAQSSPARLFGGSVLTLLPTSADEMWVVTTDEVQDVTWRTAG